jgi:hypothetical protein
MCIPTRRLRLALQSVLNVVSQDIEWLIASRETIKTKVYSLSPWRQHTIQLLILSKESNFYGEKEADEEIIVGEEDLLLVVRRVWFIPLKVKGEDWRRNNIFQSTCPMGNKVCKLVIDSGKLWEFSVIGGCSKTGLGNGEAP